MSSHWANRWFSLTGSSLAYYRREQDSGNHPRGMIDVQVHPWTVLFGVQIHAPGKQFVSIHCENIQAKCPDMNQLANKLLKHDRRWSEWRWRVCALKCEKAFPLG